VGFTIFPSNGRALATSVLSNNSLFQIPLTTAGRNQLNLGGISRGSLVRLEVCSRRLELWWVMWISRSRGVQTLLLPHYWEPSDHTYIFLPPARWSLIKEVTAHAKTPEDRALVDSDDKYVPGLLPERAVRAAGRRTSQIERRASAVRIVTVRSVDGDVTVRRREAWYIWAASSLRSYIDQYTPIRTPWSICVSSYPKNSHYGRNSNLLWVRLQKAL